MTQQQPYREKLPSYGGSFKTWSSKHNSSLNLGAHTGIRTTAIYSPEGSASFHLRNPLPTLVSVRLPLGALTELQIRQDVVNKLPLLRGEVPGDRQLRDGQRKLQMLPHLNYCAISTDIKCRSNK